MLMRLPMSLTRSQKPVHRRLRQRVSRFPQGAANRLHLGHTMQPFFVVLHHQHSVAQVAEVE